MVPLFLRHIKLGKTKVLLRLMLVSLVIPLASSQLLATQQRLRVPEFVDCPRDKVSSYDGKMTQLSLTKNRLSIDVLTSFDTQEVISISHKNYNTLGTQLRINGILLDDKSLKYLIHQSTLPFKPKGIIVWVCEIEDFLPVINWSLDT